MSNNASKGSAMHPKKASYSVPKRSLCVALNKPTKVQRNVIEMEKNEFVEETNIKNLIHRKYGKLTEQELQEKINQYFALRYNWDDWKNHVCLNDLAFKGDLSIFEMTVPGQNIVHLVSSDDEAENVALKKSKTLSAKQPRTNSFPLQRIENTTNARPSTSNQIQFSWINRKF